MALAPRPGESEQGAWIESEFGARALALQEGCARWSSRVATIPNEVHAINVQSPGAVRFEISSDVITGNRIWFYRKLDTTFFAYADASVLFNLDDSSYEVIEWPNVSGDETLGFWVNSGGRRLALGDAIGTSVYHLAGIAKPSGPKTGLVRITTSGEFSIVYEVDGTVYPSYSGVAIDREQNHVWFALKDTSNVLHILRYNINTGSTSEIYSGLNVGTGSTFISNSCGYYVGHNTGFTFTWSGVKLDGSSSSVVTFSESTSSYGAATREFQNQVIVVNPLHQNTFTYGVSRVYFPAPVAHSYPDDTGSEFVANAPSDSMIGSALSLDETKVYAIDIELEPLEGTVTAVQTVNATNLPKYPSGTFPGPYVQQITLQFPFERQNYSGANFDITGVTSGANIPQFVLVEGVGLWQGLAGGRIGYAYNVGNGTSKYVILNEASAVQNWIPGEDIISTTRGKDLGLYAFELCDSPVTPLCVTPTPFVGRWTFDFNSDIGGFSAHLGTCNGDSFKEVTATPPETIYQHSIFIQSNTYGAISFAGNTVPFYFDDVRVVRNDTGESRALGPLCPVGSPGGFGLSVTNGLQLFGTYLTTFRIAADDGTAQTYASSSKSYFASDISNTDGRAEPWPDLYDVESGISLWFPGAPEA